MSLKTSPKKCVTRYIVGYIPDTHSYKQLNTLRRRYCKETCSTQALQSPVHISFIRSTSISDINLFILALRKMCSTQSPLTIKPYKNSSVLPSRFWAGLMFHKNTALEKLQHRIENMVQQFALKKDVRPLQSPLHITFTFPAKVEHVVKCPINITSMNIHRLTILEQRTLNGPYKIYKHIDFK